MSAMQSLFPIYFSRAREEGSSIEDYNNAVATNEDNLNQNLNTLFKHNEELEATIKVLKSQITSLEEALYQEGDE